MVFSELTYVGRKDLIEMGHAATPFTFSLKEKHKTSKLYEHSASMTRTLKKLNPLIKNTMFQKDLLSESTKKKDYRLVNMSLMEV